MYSVTLTGNQGAMPYQEPRHGHATAAYMSGGLDLEFGGQNVANSQVRQPFEIEHSQGACTFLAKPGFQPKPMYFPTQPIFEAVNAASGVPQQPRTAQDP